jgi:uncharacterized protein YkwD
MTKPNKTKTNFGKIIKLISISVLFISLFSINIAHSKASEITPQNLENLINSERVADGLIPLKINDRLDSAATAKSTDMVSRNYFEHYAFGLTPWDFIIKAGYNYLYAGENLAMDFNTAEGTVSAWMNSPAHRSNILNPDYSEMGMGVVKGEYKDASGTHETTIVTNMFGRQKPIIIQIFDNFVEGISSLRFSKNF